MKHKFCWLSKETKDGWNLSLEVGKFSFSVRGFYADIKGIKKVLKGNIVFIHREKGKGRLPKK